MAGDALAAWCQDDDFPGLPSSASLERAVRRRGFDIGAGICRAGDPCPFRGLGEFSAEHLLVWCPAVRGALRAVGPPAATVALASAAAGDTRAPRSALLDVLHQSSFL
eukprot:15467082-Alexandrium_andersonii.AAC.1